MVDPQTMLALKKMGDRIVPCPNPQKDAQGIRHGAET